MRIKTRSKILPQPQTKKAQTKPQTKKGARNGDAGTFKKDELKSSARDEN